MIKRSFDIMGQPSMFYRGPMHDVEGQQAHNHHHERCMVCHGGVTCFQILPPPRNGTSFNPRYLPENHGHLPYVITQYNGVFPVPVNHDHLSYSNNHQMYKRNNSYLIHGGQPIQAVPTPWLNQHDGASGAFSWNRAPGVPYLLGSINGGGMEAANMGFHGYQVATMSRNSTAFMHPLPPIRPHQGPHNVYHPPPPLPPPMPPVQAQNMDIHLQTASTSHRHSTSTSTAYPFYNDVNQGPRFVVVGPPPPTGTRVYEARQRELMIDSTARHHNFLHLRVLPQDEELIALGEQIGNVNLGLSDKFISDQLKTRTFPLFRPSHSEEPNFCVICQMEFENQELLGKLDCCHEYHVECIKKWLNVKNNCPICKSKALAN